MTVEATEKSPASLEGREIDDDSPPNCVILGGGGHARVLIDCLRESGAANPQAIVERDAALWNTKILGVPVVGGDDMLAELNEQGIWCFLVGLGSLGDSGPRRRLFELAQTRGQTAVTVQHPSAVCASSAELGLGCQLLAASVVNTGAKLGVNVIVNTGAIVEHDCMIGDHAHIATGARLAGGVRVGSGAHIGIGASVLQNLTVGEGAIVGGGAAVVADVAPGATVVGVPAQPDSRRR